MNDLITLALEESFIQNTLFAIILSSIAGGISGTFIVAKKISYISGGIAHAMMGGLGIAYFWGVNPIYGAFAFALVTAVIIGLVKLKFSQNIDTVISAMWAIGMSIGIIFSYLTPGYNIDLLSFLFGNVLLITDESILILLFMDLFIILVVFVFYRQFLFVSFDEEYSRLRGINVDLIYIILLTVIAVTVVILVQTVGLILVIAILTLPSAISLMISNSLIRAMFISIILILLFMLCGFVIAFYANLPAGAVIILITGLAYVSAFIIKEIKT